MKVIGILLSLFLLASACLATDVEGKLKDKQRVRLALMLQDAPALAESYIKDRAKHKDRAPVRICGSMPIWIIIESGDRLACDNNLLGMTDNWTAWIAGFNERTIWHEIAHCLFRETATHYDKEYTGVPEDFAEWCLRKFKEKKRAGIPSPSAVAQKEGANGNKP